PVWLDREATVRKACELIREAGSAGADLVGFPENFIPGHPSWYYFQSAHSARSMELAIKLVRESIEVPGEAVAELCQAAASASVDVVMGLTERVPGSLGTLYNTQLFIDSSGRVAGKHQKLLATLSERMVHAPGGPETQQVFQSGLGTLSSLICGENSNPLAVAMIASNYPTVHVAAWPNNFMPGPGSMRIGGLLAARNVAYMCKCFVISSCGVNSDAMIADMALTAADDEFMRNPEKTGGTCIIAPSSEVLVGPMPGDEEGIVYADVNLEDCIRGRLLHDVAGHYNRSDVYRLLVNNAPSPLVSPLVPVNGAIPAVAEPVDGTVQPASAAPEA
ncbi:MAG: carbon-nitrogen hydrolase family protein, partial [Pseudonocardia sp.]|nr:carbon-nitrogen hydrolase family protein [Pseudonocardia sp.]